MSTRDYHAPCGCGFALHAIVIGLVAACAIFFGSGCSEGGDFLDSALLQGGDKVDDLTDSVTGVEESLSRNTEEIRLLRGEVNQEGQDLENAIRETSAAEIAAGQRQVEDGADPDDIPDENENGGVIDRSQTYNDLNQAGFVWKPISEGDGNLVVLLRPSSSGDPIRALSLVYGGGSEVGSYVGLTNGGRPTFRFRMPGCGYGTNIVLIPGDTAVNLAQTIPNGCKREDGLQFTP